MNGVASLLKAKLADVAVAILVLITLVSCILRTSGHPVVIVYGDSLTVQSEDAARSLHTAVKERVVFRAYGGTAMCDWLEQARFDALALHPSRVVLAFTGNIASCAAAAYRDGGAAGATALYESSLRQMRAAFPKSHMTIVIPPAMHNLPQGWFPFNGNPALVAMYERVGPQLHMGINTDADNWLTPGHVYRTQRSAYPTGPVVDVRLSDGVHLTPAGELWYGAALLEAK